MREASPEKQAHYARRRREGAKKAWEKIKRKKAAKMKKFKNLGKRVAAVVKGRQWEQGKERHLKGASKKSAPNTCVNCGDNRPYVLHRHHVEPEEETLVMLCANCHDIVRRAGLKELREARDRANI